MTTWTRLIIIEGKGTLKVESFLSEIERESSLTIAKVLVRNEIDNVRGRFDVLGRWEPPSNWKG